MRGFSPPPTPPQLRWPGLIDHTDRVHGQCVSILSLSNGMWTPSVVLNPHHDVVNFALPEVVGGTVWCCLLDTNNPTTATGKHFKQVKLMKSPADP
jgi:hypothetical protein